MYVIVLLHKRILFDQCYIKKGLFFCKLPKYLSKKKAPEGAFFNLIFLLS